MDNRHSVLLVDDERSILDLLKLQLESEGYQVYTAENAAKALNKLSYTPDIILLDINMRGTNGLELCVSIRDFVACPILFLTARISEQDKVNGLMAGGDDYITKPFSMDELLARIVVQFRKMSGNGSSKILEYDGITLDTSTREVLVNSQNVRLTKTEFAILKLLMENPKQIITKTILLDRISEDTPDCMESSLRVHISNLRKKLRDVSGKDHIEAVWGIGFKMAEN